MLLINLFFFVLVLVYFSKDLSKVWRFYNVSMISLLADKNCASLMEQNVKLTWKMKKCLGCGRFKVWLSVCEGGQQSKRQALILHFLYLSKRVSGRQAHIFLTVGSWDMGSKTKVAYNWIFCHYDMFDGIKVWWMKRRGKWLEWLK